MADKFRELLKVTEAAEELSLHPQTVNKLCRDYEKGLPKGLFSRFDQKGRRRISIDDIEDFLLLTEKRPKTKRGVENGDD